MQLQVGVKILLKNKDGKYLVLYRSREKYPEALGRWDIVGGRIEPGIPLIENLKREVMEEIGLEIIGEPKLLTAQDILRIEGRHVVRLTYTGEALGEVSIDEENEDFKWLSIEEMADLDLDIYFKEFLEKFGSKINYEFK